MPLGRRVLASVLAANGAMARAAMALFALLTSAAKPELVLRPDAIPKADALRTPVAAVRARRIAMTENAVTTVAAANAAPVPAIWCAVMGNAMIATSFAPIKKRLAAG